MGLRTILAAGVAAGALVGCVVSSSDSTASAGAGPAPAQSSSGGGTGVQVVEVDPGQTLTVQAGQGVGVFVEYATGGHWTVSWTCDTSLSALPCHFANDISVGAGAITNVQSQFAEQNAGSSQPSPASLDATSVTTTGLDALTFDTEPGATITIDAQVDGSEQGSFFFFVQNGKVNGGYQGQLADPLMFQPSSP